jgi:glucose uptake protein
MDIITILLAIATVLAWGTWLAPSQGLSLPNPQTRALYVAIGNVIVAAIALAFAGAGRLSAEIFVYPFCGGLIWAISGWCAFGAAERIGMARAFGTWAPLNIVVGIVWGMVLFGEFLRSGPGSQMAAVGAIAAIIGGLLFIIFAGGGNKEAGGNGALLGFAGAVGAGILWGTYFVPTAYLARRTPGVDDWVTSFPLAVGMLVGSAVLVVLGGRSPKLPTGGAYARALSSGVLWSVGNFSMLLLVSRIGMGRGFTIAQLCVVVNALVGILFFHEPPIRSRAARRTIIGVLLATLGGVILGNLKG